MPELAEVAYACSLWNKGLGKKVVEIITHPTTRVYREVDRNQFAKDFLHLDVFLNVTMKSIASCIFRRSVIRG